MKIVAQTLVFAAARLISMLFVRTWAAVRTKNSFFQSLFRRLVPRLGTQRRSGLSPTASPASFGLCFIAKNVYRELGPLGGNPKSIQARLHKMVRQLNSLGYQIVAPTEA